MEKENYKQQIARMSQDPLVLADIEAVQQDFKDALVSLENKEDEIYEDLLDIGRCNFTDGYGAIILAIQEKYILIPKSELDNDNIVKEQ